MVTTEYLFNKVNDLYGNSKISLSALANELGITYTQARHLTVEAGYHYHTRMDPPVTPEEFEDKPWAKFIQTKL